MKTKNNRRIATSLPVNKPTEETTHILVSLFYSKGGPNFFTAQFDRKGYYVSVSPVKEENQNGYSTVTCVLGTGCKLLIEESARFNHKRLESLWEVIDKNIKDGTRCAVTDMINEVAKKSKVGVN